MDRRTKKHLRTDGIYESHPLERVLASVDVEKSREAVRLALMLAIASTGENAFAFLRTALTQLHHSLKRYDELHTPLVTFE